MEKIGILGLSLRREEGDSFKSVLNSKSPSYRKTGVEK